jgi:preprotein translocase subunit SecD
MYEQILAMITSMEDMVRNAGDFEKHVKEMMEQEGRMHGIELDRRHSARDMWETLMEHIQTNAPDEHAELLTEPADPNMHMHDDGVEHSHEDGSLPHSHEDEYTSSELSATGDTITSNASQEFEGDNMTEMHVEHDEQNPINQS